MSSYSYLVAWAWYLVAVVGLAVFWWVVTRRLPPLSRDLFRVLPVAWALTPWTVSPEHSFLAPAWLVTLFEGLLREDGNPMRGGQGLVLATLLALIPVLIRAISRRKQRDTRRAGDSGETLT